MSYRHRVALYISIIRLKKKQFLVIFFIKDYDVGPEITVHVIFNLCLCIIRPWLLISSELIDLSPGNGNQRHRRNQVVFLAVLWIHIPLQRRIIVETGFGCMRILTWNDPDPCHLVCNAYIYIHKYIQIVYLIFWWLHVKNLKNLLKLHIYSDGSFHAFLGSKLYCDCLGKKYIYIEAKLYKCIVFSVQTV